MKIFLLKGILKDKSRSLLPIIIVGLGAMLTVLLYSWLKGVIGESIIMNANFNTGHVKVISREQAKTPEQMAIDLSLVNIAELKKELKKNVSDMDWVERIRFGSLIDFPDSEGETRAQGPVIGWGLDILSPNTKERERFNLAPSIKRGKMPSKHGEALISEDFAEKFEVKPGDVFTLFGSTMEGGMAFQNFTVSGTVKFGAQVLDRGAIIIDIQDAQQAFQMPDAAGEILGFFNSNLYDTEKAMKVKVKVNAMFASDTDKYAPAAITLQDQEGMGQYLDYADAIGGILITIFISAMAIVLWNSGLLGGLRRYTEFGVRLALGEDKTHIYVSLLYEAVAIGLIGSLLGSFVGVLISYWIQQVGIDLGGMMQGSTLMMPTVIRTAVTPTTYYIGFIPGVFSIVIGNALAGIGIYKRSTARLFNELEV
ncbi:MAG: hypothetical protein A2X64_08610 [Ignavibacteria bacterium GWF2_33_9]|nr:MAG: hypothetical protein A2X64_08610 [Ignavibacteria bacterium GWF2_33_9]